jgi:hypothetical protein
MDADFSIFVHSTGSSNHDIWRTGTRLATLLSSLSLLQPLVKRDSQIRYVQTTNLVAFISRSKFAPTPSAGVATPDER